MITVDKLTRSPRYLIAESAVSFTENYQGVNKEGNPIYDVVAVSVSSEAAIMVFDENNGISYGDDLQYQRWRLNGVTTGLVSTEAHNIYARLNKEGKKEATIIFSVRNYRTDGSYPYIDEDGVEVLSEPSAAYYYILIGTLTALDSSGRTLTFDPGRLSTQQQQNEQGGGWVAEMFELVRDAENLIRAKLRFENLRVKGESLFGSIANFYKGIKIGPSDSAKAITSVATDFSTSEDATDAAATPAYVKAFSEGRYLSKTSTDPQSVAGSVTFEQNVTVGGDHAVNGNQAIEGAQEVKGEASFKEDVTFGNYSGTGASQQGAKITKEGMASFAGVEAKYFKIHELIYNIQTSEDGVKSFSDNGIIDEVVSVEEVEHEIFSHRAVLAMRDTKENGVTTFKHDDIVFGYVRGIGASGESVVGGQCWMVVESVDGLTVTATVYDSSVLLGVVSDSLPQILPTGSMAITRWGNVSNASRQSSFYISTEQGNIVQLMGVSSPNITEANIGTVQGLLPEEIKSIIIGKFANYNELQPYFYGKGIIVQDLMQIDYRGNVIKTERYRGGWSSAIAYGSDPYMVTDTTYDTVTYDGSKWECKRSNTKAEPSKYSTDWGLIVSKGDEGVGVSIYDIRTYYGVNGSLTEPAEEWFDSIEEANPQEGDVLWVKYETSYTDGRTPTVTYTASRQAENGKDSTAVQYTIEVLPNVIYVDNTDALSQETIDVFVGRDSSGGYEQLAAPTSLAQYGLHVEYSYDDGERKQLIKDTETLDLEDGTSLLAENGSDLVLAFTVETIKDVRNHIVFYLVDEEGKELAVSYVPVYGNGRELSVQCTPSSLSYNVGAETGETTDEAVMKEVIIEVKSGGETIELDSVDLAIYDNNNDAMAYTQLNATQCKIELLVSKGSSMSDLPRYFHVSAQSKNNPLRSASYQLPIHYLQRGLVGESGPMLFPMGAYDPTINYTLVYDQEGKITAQPFVYNKFDKNYYVLQKDIDANCTGIGDDRYWRVFTKIQYLFTEALMADFALLAKAVFHGDYMFSQYGVGKDGAVGDYSEYMGDEGSKGSMFDENGRFTEDFTPNLFLDFLGGGAKFGKLSESFMRLPQETAYHAINMASSHNVSVSYRGYFPRVVSLPSLQDGWSEDGTHVTIAYDYWHDYSLPKSDSFMDDYYQHMLIVCADSRFFVPESSDNAYFDKLSGNDGMPSQSDGWIIWNGVRCKFLILEPSSMAMFRSLRNEDGGVVWFVENSSEFQYVKVMLEVYRDYEEGATHETIYNDGPDPSSILLGKVIGSPSLNRTDGEYVKYLISATEKDDDTQNAGQPENLYHARFIGVTDNQ